MLVPNNDAINHTDGQVLHGVQGGPQEHQGTQTEPVSQAPDRQAGTFTANKSQQPHLGPIDRLVAAKKSRQISKKVVETARQSRSLDYHIKFLSEQKIRELVDSAAVSLELTRSRKGSLGTPCPERFRKILTILYLLGLPTKVRLFVLRDACDEDLPFEISAETRNNGSTGLRSKKNPKAPLVYFKRRGDAEEFVQHQWSVMVHVFSPLGGSKIPHYTLQDCEVLPFTGQKPMNRQGASGEVFRTWIHPDHHFWEWNKAEVCHHP